MCHHKCKKMCGALFVVFGVLFLLQNLSVWKFLGMARYTVVFLLLGLGMIAAGGCPECQKASKK